VRGTRCWHGSDASPLAVSIHSRILALSPCVLAPVRVVQIRPRGKQRARMMRRTTLVIALSASAAAFSPQTGVFLSPAQVATFYAPKNALQGSRTLLCSSGRPFELTPSPALRMEAPSSSSELVSGRRDFLAAVLSAAIVGGLSAPCAAVAKDAINDCEKWAPGRKWISGKSCQARIC
jgi:hypothetical protein